MTVLPQFNIEGLDPKSETQFLNNKIQIIKSPVSGVEYYDNEGFWKKLLLERYSELTPKQDVILLDPELLTKIDEVEYLPIFFADNQKRLFEKLHKEIKELKIDFEKTTLIIDKFKTIIKYIAELPFTNCSIEITKSNSIKISLSFQNNILLILSKPLEEIKEVSENDIIFSVFRQKEMIASNVESTSGFFRLFKKFINL
jgi:hypothetical protein